jgi:hypothetical protein
MAVALTMQLPIGIASIESSAQSLDNDDATLYVLALQDSRLNGQVAPTDPLVLQRQTIDHGMIFDFPADVPRPDYLDPSKRLAYAGADTVASVLQLKAGEDLPPTIARTANVRFADKGELERLERGLDGWPRLQKRFGTGVRLIRLSAIARNDEDTAALLYISYACGLLCGKGHFVLFKRESGAWRVERIDLFSES